RDKAAQIAEGDGLSFGADVLGAGLEHDDSIARAPKTRWAPSPARGGGLGWGNARANLDVCPLPAPPPQAGEGTLEPNARCSWVERDVSVRRSVVKRTKRPCACAPRS